MRVVLACGLVTAAAVIGAALLARSPLPAPPAGHAPRLIVLVTIDALRADHLGIYGYARPTSPHLDRFARESVVVEDAIAHAPYTKASIASLLTGLYPTAHKTFTVSATFADAMNGHVGAVPKTDVLPPDAVTLAEALKARGYGTAAFTANPYLIAQFGFAQGFDRFEFIGGHALAPAREVLGRALRAIDDARQPMFVWAHVMEPHAPYTPDERFKAAFPPLLPPRPTPPEVTVPDYLAGQPSRDAHVFESLYDAEIRTVDEALGAFLDSLRARADWSRTAVVVTADHGEQFLEHGGLEHNTNLYDELIRVPLIVHLPGLVPRYVHAQAQLVDVMPTLLVAVGGRADPAIHGRDLGPLLRGESIPSEPAFSELPGVQYAVRTRDWKLIAGPGENRELYALTRDPGERYSLAQPRRLAEMQHVLDRMLASAVEAGRRIAGETAPVDPVVRRRLEALGYAQH